MALYDKTSTHVAVTIPFLGSAYGLVTSLVQNSFDKTDKWKAFIAHDLISVGTGFHTLLYSGAGGLGGLLVGGILAGKRGMTFGALLGAGLCGAYGANEGYKISSEIVVHGMKALKRFEIRAPKLTDYNFIPNRPGYRFEVRAPRFQLS